MRNKYRIRNWLTGLLVVFITLGFSINSNAQGVETFENSTATGSYLDGSFVGDEGFEWTFGHSRDEGTFPIDDEGLMLRRASDSFLEAEIPGGVGSFSFQYRKAFTGAAARQLELIVNGEQVAVSPVFGDSSVDDETVFTFTADNINTAGNVTVRIKNVGTTTTNRQTVIDNIEWTSFEDGSPTLSASPSSLSNFLYSTVEGGPSESQFFTLSGADLDPADAAITISAPDNFEVSLDDVAFSSSLTVNASENALADTSVFVRLVTGLDEGSFSGDVTISGGGADNATVSLSGEVEAPLTATLPYEEGFESDLSGVYTFQVSGDRNWQQGSASGRTYARINGFNSGFVENSWLILPGFDLTETENETMRFETWFNFGSDNEDNFLKLWYSIDYPGIGDPSGFTWTELNFNRPESSQNITASGNVDLSGIDSESVYVAFQYNYEPGSYREWRVFDIEIFEGGMPELTLNQTEVSGLDYIFGSGPSVSEEVLVSGTNLDPVAGGITVTAPDNFEISFDETSWTDSGQLVYADGGFTDRSLYVRLADGLDVGDYTGEISLAGGGAEAVDLSVSGSVSEAPPSLTADPYFEQFRDFESAETLPDGWSVSNQSYAGNWGTGTGGGLRGNASVLGFQHTGGTGTFTATLELRNDTGEEITELFVNYTGRVERDDEGRSPVWSVEVNGSEVAGLMYSTEENLETTQYVQVSGLTIPEGDSFTISWSSERGGGGGSSKQIGISDVVVSVDPFFAASILGIEGFRILTTPAENASYGQVLSSIWTQGFSGADYPLGESNILIYSESTQSYQSPANASNRFGTVSDIEASAGRAAFVYVYADDNRNQIDDPFPKLLLYDGTPNTGDLTLTLSYTDSGDSANDGWHLVGNPFSSSLNWASITDDDRNSNLSDVFYMYDSALDAYRLINGAPTEPDDIINPNTLIASHQGGWVKVLDDAGGSLGISESDIATDGAELYDAPEQVPFVQLNLEAADRGDYAAVVFREDAAAGVDRRDAYQLAPLTDRYAHIYTRSNNSFMMVENRMFGETEYIIPVGINSSVAEAHTLTWNDLDALPYDWKVYLTDHLTGEQLDLRLIDSYTFEHSPNSEGTSKVSAIERVAERNSPVMFQDEKSEERFTLEITMTTTSVPTEELPQVVALNQNYPNPFNPTT
ncbi:MAG: DUF5017 domain-containing protein, partial [Balneolales bacterium]|nr:DUF5017 domain-containing protein [Balneolales bacterium]